MMLTADQIDAITNAALKSFHSFEVALSTEGAKALASGATAQEIRAAIEAVGDANRAKLAKAVETALRTAARESLAGQEAIYQAARTAGIAASYIPVAQSTAITPLLAQGLSTLGAMTNIVQTRAVLATSSLVVDAFDSATLGVLTGSVSRDEAVRQAVRQIAAKQATITYVSEAGRVTNSSIYGAARRAIVTGTNRTTGRMQEVRMRETGAEWVQVSAHMGARPEHADWQGIVCRFDELGDKTGYGSGEGLQGWNCRHSWGPFFPGIMEPADNSWVDDERSAEIYELSQRQRLAERNVREYDRRVNVLDAGGQDAGKERALRAKWEREAQRTANLQGGKVRPARMRGVA